jgi:hypothetical protein
VYLQASTYIGAERIVLMMPVHFSGWNSIATMTSKSVFKKSSSDNNPKKWIAATNLDGVEKTR